MALYTCNSVVGSGLTNTAAGHYGNTVHHCVEESEGDSSVSGGEWLAEGRRGGGEGEGVVVHWSHCTTS